MNGAKIKILENGMLEYIKTADGGCIENIVKDSVEFKPQTLRDRGLGIVVVKLEIYVFEKDIQIIKTTQP